MGAPKTDIKLISYKDCGNPLIIELTDEILKRGDPKGKVKGVFITDLSGLNRNGDYRPWNRKIRIDERLLKNPVDYSYVLAHEIGHSKQFPFSDSIAHIGTVLLSSTCLIKAGLGPGLSCIIGGVIGVFPARLGGIYEEVDADRFAHKLTGISVRNYHRFSNDEDIFYKTTFKNSVKSLIEGYPDKIQRLYLSDKFYGQKENKESFVRKMITKHKLAEQSNQERQA